MIAIYLLLALGVGIAVGVFLSDRRSPARLVAGSMALVGLVLLPALAFSQAGRMHTLPQNAVQGLGSQNFAFAINYGWDDDWWVAVHPSAKARQGQRSELLTDDAVPLGTFEVYTFEANSHCYTVVSGGKAYEVCPSH